MSVLNILIGLVVSRIDTVHDYIQFVFSDGTMLSVLNNFVYDGESVLKTEGRKVESVDGLDKAIVIQFEGGESLRIGLTDEDYNGPEAIVLKQEGKSPVVWN